MLLRHKSPMPEGSERQADEDRADLYALHDELEFLREQIARLPTCKDSARLALLAMLTGPALTDRADAGVFQPGGLLLAAC
jgi:hypothetical protein